MNDPIGDDPRHGLKIRGLTSNPRAEPLDGANAAESAETTSAIDATSAASSTEITETATIAQSISSGAIDASAAQSQLIEAVVASQLPENATAELAAAVRSEVEAMLAGNPLLADLLRPS